MNQELEWNQCSESTENWRNHHAPPDEGTGTRITGSIWNWCRVLRERFWCRRRRWYKRRRRVRRRRRRPWIRRRRCGRRRLLILSRWTANSLKRLDKFTGCCVWHEWRSRIVVLKQSGTIWSANELSYHGIPNQYSHGNLQQSHILTCCILTEFSKVGQL